MYKKPTVEDALRRLKTESKRIYYWEGADVHADLNVVIEKLEELMKPNTVRCDWGIKSEAPAY